MGSIWLPTTVLILCMITRGQAYPTYDKLDQQLNELLSDAYDVGKLKELSSVLSRIAENDRKQRRNNVDNIHYGRRGDEDINEREDLLAQYLSLLVQETQMDDSRERERTRGSRESAEQQQLETLRCLLKKDLAISKQKRQTQGETKKFLQQSVNSTNQAAAQAARFKALLQQYAGK